MMKSLFQSLEHQNSWSSLESEQQQSFQDDQKSQIIEQLQMNAVENLHQQVQSIIATTFFQINQLEDDAISQLASEYQDKSHLNLNLQYMKDKQKEFPETKDQKLFEQLALTLNTLTDVKFKFMLLLEIDLVENNKSLRIFDEIKDNVIRFEKIIMLLESQLSMIQFIQKNHTRLHFKEKYYEKYVMTLHNFAIDINFLIKAQKQSQTYSGRKDQNSVKNLENYDSFCQIRENQGSVINLKAIIQAQETLRQILRQYSQAITEFKQILSQKRSEKYIIRGLNILKVINAKITTISQILPYCCILDKNDLFSYETTSPRWQKLISECITYRTFADRQTLKASFDDFRKNLNLVNCSMGILDRTRKLKLLNFSSWIQILRSTQYLLKCIMFKDAAKKQAEFMISHANTELMKQVWNLPEHKIFRDFAEFVFPSIEHSQRLYIPRICKDYFNSNGQQPLPDYKILFLNQYGNELFKKKNYNESLRIRINVKYHLKAKFNIIDENIKKQSQGNGLFMRTISKVCQTFNHICHMNQSNIYVPDKIIFHIHGGGFISMSSFIHQVYTRTWANELEVPIVSVDYGKAPEHPYPESLYDCLQAYLWILYCFEQVYHVQPKKIIFLGDSAGGNLAASLINLLIAWKLRVPDGLVMCYPVLSVTSKKYTRSLLGTLQDMILPHTLMKLCENSYAKNRQYQNDPLISPLFTPTEYLKRFPETRIFVGSKDPFHDDCCRFTERMNSVAPGKCYLTIFQEFPHGFLQFDIKTHPHDLGRKANSQIRQTIHKIFQ